MNKPPLLSGRFEPKATELKPRDKALISLFLLPQLRCPQSVPSDDLPLSPEKAPLCFLL